MIIGPQWIGPTTCYLPVRHWVSQYVESVGSPENRKTDICEDLIVQ